MDEEIVVNLLENRIIFLRSAALNLEHEHFAASANTDVFDGKPFQNPVSTLKIENSQTKRKMEESKQNIACKNVNDLKEYRLNKKEKMVKISKNSHKENFEGSINN